MTISNIDKDLKSFVERLVHCEEQKKAAVEDIKEIIFEAKSSGFDIPALRQVVKFSMDDDKKTKEQKKQEMIELYMHDLGMLSDTPLGQAAIHRVENDE
jgi:uncharacterized protein (UPF0335 family)